MKIEVVETDSEEVLSEIQNVMKKRGFHIETGVTEYECESPVKRRRLDETMKKDQEEANVDEERVDDESFDEDVIDLTDDVLAFLEATKNANQEVGHEIMKIEVEETNEENIVFPNSEENELNSPMKENNEEIIDLTDNVLAFIEATKNANQEVNNALRIQ